MNSNTIIRICKTHGETEWYSYDNANRKMQVCKECRKAQRRARYKDPIKKKNDTEYTATWIKNNPELTQKYYKVHKELNKQKYKDRSAAFYNENILLIQKCMVMIHPRKHAEMDLHTFYSGLIGKHFRSKSTMEGFKQTVSAALYKKYSMNASVSLKHKYNCIKNYSEQSDELKIKIRSESKIIANERTDLTISNLFA
jgi:hypothetical protein